MSLTGEPKLSTKYQLTPTTRPWAFDIDGIEELSLTIQSKKDITEIVDKKDHQSRGRCQVDNGSLHGCAPQDLGSMHRGPKSQASTEIDNNPPTQGIKWTFTNYDLSFKVYVSILQKINLLELPEFPPFAGEKQSLTKNNLIEKITYWGSPEVASTTQDLGFHSSKKMLKELINFIESQR